MAVRRAGNILFALAGLVLVFGLAGCDEFDRIVGSGEEETVYRIYVSGPTEGRQTGQDLYDSVQIAIDQFGQGIEGAKIEAVQLNDSDSQGQFVPALVRRNARKAASDPRTIAYIGDLQSGASEISAPILNRAGILQVSATSTALGLTRSDPEREAELQPSGTRTFARVVPNDLVQAAAIGQFMVEESVYSVFLVDDGGAYGAGLAELAKKALGDFYEIEIKGTGRIRSEKQVPGMVERVVEAQPDAVLLAGSDLPLGRDFFGKVNEADPTIKLFGGDAFANPQFTRSLGEVGLDTYLTTPMLPADNYARSGSEYLSAFEEKYGREPEPMGIFGYEAAAAIIYSFREVDDGRFRQGSPERLRQAVRNVFFSIRERESSLGSYSIDAYGDTSLSFYGAYRVEDGELVLGRSLDIPPYLIRELRG